MIITIMQGAFLPVPPLLGGAVEKRWHRLARELAELGHEVHHISRSYPGLPESETVQGVRYERVSGFDTPSSMLILKVCDFLYTRHAIRKIPRNTDVIVTNTFWAPLLLDKDLRHRCMVDVARMPKGQMKWYAKAGRLRANSTPVSEAIKAEISASEYHRVSLIPNPLPFAIKHVFTAEKKEESLMYCGRVHPEKGLDLLIEAMRKLENPWPLEIIGPWQTEQGGGGGRLFAAASSSREGTSHSFSGTHSRHRDAQQIL